MGNLDDMLAGAGIGGSPRLRHPAATAPDSCP